MGRHEKVTAAEVKDVLENGGDCQSITIKEVAHAFGVTTETIRKKLRSLRESGEPIIHGREGLRLINKEDVRDEDVALMLQSFTNWILGSIKNFYFCAAPIKPLLPQMKRTLQLDMTSNERRQLSKSCGRLKALVDHIEIENEIDEI